MNGADAIASLGNDLDTWLEDAMPTFASTDRAAQGRALYRGIKMVRGLDAIKLRGLAALKGLLDQQPELTEAERIPILLRGFEFGARLAHALHDEFLDTDGETKVVRLLTAIVKTLDDTGAGRAALSALLEHPDAGVRASAGGYLIKSMPNRVAPILLEIENSEQGNSAHFTALFARAMWERDGK